jgi:UDP:flavonoid glycosyltransferase YjiC (YdhE family)
MQEHRKVSEAVRSKHQSETLRFTSAPLDLALVGPQCDLAILSGGHGVTASMLLAGKPMLQIPMHLEQALNSAAVVRLGAGLVARSVDPEDVAAKLATLLDSDLYAASARQFAARYADYLPDHQVARIVDRLEGNLQSR